MSRETKLKDAGASVLAATIDIARRALGRFALVLDGDALAPRYENGDVLLVDAAAVPTAGDAVIIEVAGKFGAMLLNGDGDVYDRRGGFLTPGAYRIAGVVYGAVHREEMAPP